MVGHDAYGHEVVTNVMKLEPGFEGDLACFRCEDLAVTCGVVKGAFGPWTVEAGEVATRVAGVLRHGGVWQDAGLDTRDACAPLGIFGAGSVGLFVGGAEGDAEAEGSEPAQGVLIMLFGEDLGGGHEGGLPAGLNRDEHGGEGHDGFAAAHVAVEQTVHGNGIGHVLTDFVETAKLGGGEVEGEILQESLQQIADGLLSIAALESMKLAMEQEAQLQQIKFFESEVTTGLGEGVEVGRGVQQSDGFAAGVAGKFAVGFWGGQQVGEVLTVQVLKQMPKGGAKGFLFEVAAQPVDGDDATGVNAWGGGIGVLFENHLVIGMIHEQPVFGLLDLAVDDEVHVDREGFLHEGHAEPAKGQLMLAVGGVGWNGGGFEHGVATETQQSGAEDAQVMADGIGIGMEAGEGNLAAVLVPGGEDLQEVGRGFQSFARKLGANGRGDDFKVTQRSMELNACGLWHWRNGGSVLG